MEKLCTLKMVFIFNSIAGGNYFAINANFLHKRVHIGPAAQ